MVWYAALLVRKGVAMVNLQRCCVVAVLFLSFVNLAYAAPVEQRPLTGLAVSGAARQSGIGLFAYWLDGPLYTYSGSWSGSYTDSMWNMSFTGLANGLEVQAVSQGTIDYAASTAAWTNQWTYQGNSQSTTGTANLDFEISDSVKDVVFFGAGIVGEAAKSTSIAVTGVIAQGVEWATDFVEAGVNTTTEMKEMNAEQQNLNSQLQINWTNAEKRKKNRVDREFGSSEESTETNGSGEIESSWTYSIPEPSILLLAGLGLVGVLGLGRKKLRP